MALCFQEIKAQKNHDKKIFANMFDKFARIDAKREEDFKRREKPIEINEWKDNKRDWKESETLTVKGDIQVMKLVHFCPIFFTSLIRMSRKKDFG